MSTSSQVLSGAVVQVAQGVLRGVGPMGPRGFPGDLGPRGLQGLVGPQPELDPVTARFTRSTDTNVRNDAVWDGIALEANTWSVGDMASLSGDGTVVLVGAHPDGVSTLLSVSMAVRPGAAGTEELTFEIGLFTVGAATPFASQTFRHTSGAIPSVFALTASTLVSTGTAVRVMARTWDGAVSPVVDSVELVVTRAGGPKGPPGGSGPIGATGPTGPAGSAGNSGTGYSTLDALDSTGDSDVDPTGSDENSQGLPYPTGALAPRIPFFLRNLAGVLATRVLRRFDTTASLTGAADIEVGQIGFVAEDNSLHISVDAGSGTIGQPLVAQLTYGTGDPPAGTFPTGTLYFKVT